MNYYNEYADGQLGGEVLPELHPDELNEINQTLPSVVEQTPPSTNGSGTALAIGGVLLLIWLLSDQ